MISNAEPPDWNERPGEQLVTDSQWNEIASVLELTQRELDVCQRLFVEMTRHETAADMGIKSRTVRHYMERIHSKLNVNNRVGVVLRIIQVRDNMDPEEPMNSVAPAAQ